MAKLTDLQLVALSCAAKRESGTLLPLPKSVKSKSAEMAKALKSLLARSLVQETPTRRAASSWREVDGQRMGLTITQSGLDALGLGDATVPEAEHKRANSTATKTTKSEHMLTMLTKPQGASIAELQKATGWQAHSIRGALSTLRKNGTPVLLSRHDDRPSTYHVGRSA